MNTDYLHSSTVKVSIRIDNSDKKLQFKAITVESGILSSHLRYLKQSVLFNAKSESWRNQSIQSIRLLIDYSIVNKDVFINPLQMFEAFSSRIFGGTINEKGTDPTGLYWDSFSENGGNTIINHITSFSDWLYDDTGGESELLNPKRQVTKAEKILNLAAYNHRINKAFLGHTYSEEHKEQSVITVRNVGRRRTNVLPDFDPHKAFREDKIWELISVGFARKGVLSSSPVAERYNLQNVLITMLLHFGGLRTSEPFHIYTDDIIPNKGLRQIRVYHHSLGLAPQWFRENTKQPNADRKTFLLQKYGLTPRYRHPKDAYKAGWKNPVVSQVGHYMDVFLFGAAGIHDMFYDLFLAYMKARTPPKLGREHPFLFTNKNGDPLSMGSYKDAHKAAVLKIGLIPLLYRGGTPHCHRHAYGTRMKECGIDPLDIKVCMHHACLEAQEVYKPSNSKTIRQHLDEGSKTLESQGADLLINKGKYHD
jgi:hypothetical protein